MVWLNNKECGIEEQYYALLSAEEGDYIRDETGADTNWISTCVTACLDIKMNEFVIGCCERGYTLVDRVHVLRVKLISCEQSSYLAIIGPKPLTSVLVAVHSAASEYDEVSRSFLMVAHVHHKHLHSPADGGTPLRRVFPVAKSFIYGRAFPSLQRVELGAFQAYVRITGSSYDQLAESDMALLMLESHLESV